MTGIPFPKSPDGIYIAGDDLGMVWRNLSTWKCSGEAGFGMAVRRQKTSCPAQGCHYCTNPDCPCSVFIRQYLNYPKGD